ncbi:hypothetical protein SYNPS1DRAFT_26938 [Syncephalis pseudoplumigaleata]|uniref:Uncharacterized protein n=1 Tax=Syncephalis pseudoplumigaleata TaxID=1712513 RepID=A0A4P9Z6E1_9FUNG|nr:hypothetical protein SYNPS1DRAFT_26938 [Syncephalis pseudoplumigaleata]|eukprot:RKP27411.1 hypothetical protein SYNPS1DRAFT_26938 [Syncephalis pseudoplumigaleata]
MQFTSPPPFAPHCDYSVNFHDCQDERFHLIIFIVSVAFHLVAIAVGCYTTFWLNAASYPAADSLGASSRNNLHHQLHNQQQQQQQQQQPSGKPHGACLAESGEKFRLIRQPMKVSSIMWVAFLVARLVHNTVCMLELVPLLSVRLLLMSLSVCFGCCCIFIFAAGVIETVHLTMGQAFFQQKSYLHQVLQLRMPSPRAIIWSLVVLVLTTTLAHLVLIFMAGSYGQAGDWRRYRRYSHYAWAIWSVSYVAMGVLYTYYALILTIILKQLLPADACGEWKSPSSLSLEQHLRHHPSENELLSAAAANAATAASKSPDTCPSDGIGRMEFAYMADHKQYNHHHRHNSGHSWQSVSLYDRRHSIRTATGPATIIKQLDRDATAADAYSARSECLAPGELELNEKIKSIRRLRSMLFYLLFIYLFTIVSVFLWGFASNLLFTAPIFNRIAETLYVAVLVPVLALGIFYRQWQMDRSRRRQARLASIGRRPSAWSLPFPPKGDDNISLDGLDKPDAFDALDALDALDAHDDAFHPPLSDHHDDHNTPAPASFPLSF